MKKISFEKMNFESSDILSRLQMKRVKGGHISLCLYEMDGDNGCSGGTASFECSGTGEACQDLMDIKCENDNCCNNVDCRKIG
jgi:hypothetical protein